MIVGSVVIPREEIPEEAIDCIDREDHQQDWETLTLYIGGWACHSGIYRKETEHVILWFCSLHNVVILMGNRRKTVIAAFTEQAYQRLLERLRSKFPSVDGKEQELEEMVDWLFEHFPLYKA